MRKDTKAKERLIQGENGKRGGEIFRDYMRGTIRATLWELMQEEVGILCGRSHRPEPGAICRRAGSNDGVMYLNGSKEAIKRPRVRRRQVLGGELELRLQTYEQARATKNIEEVVVSVRGQAWYIDIMLEEGCRF